MRGWWLRVVGLAGVIIFVALCRTEPSVLRAAAMGLVALAALGSGSRAAGVRNLAFASMICSWWIHFSAGRSASRCRLWPVRASFGGPDAGP